MHDSKVLQKSEKTITLTPSDIAALAEYGKLQIKGCEVALVRKADEDVLLATVKPSGTTGRVIIPKKYIGYRAVILLFREEIEKYK